MNEVQCEEEDNPNYLHVVGDNDEVVRYQLDIDMTRSDQYSHECHDSGSASAARDKSSMKEGRL